MRSSMRLAGIAALVALIAACASRPPAPVVDRQPTPKPQAAAAAAAPVRDERPETYTVKRGDTLYSIALDNGVDWRDVASLNGLSDPGRLQVGQVLRLRAAPPPGQKTADAGAGVQVNPIAGSGAIQARPLGGEPPPAATPLPAAAATAGAAAAAGSLLKTEPKAAKLPYSDDNLAALQRADARPAPKPEAPPVAAAKPEAPPAPKPEAAAKPAEAPKNAAVENLEDGVEWSWPADGKIIAAFSDSSKGVQIAGRPGDPVLATATGEVVYVGTGIRGLGKLVVIRHSDKYLSVYGHNRDILVKEKQRVSKGQKIAEVGSTDADQPKLHFEIRRFGKPVDPMQFLPPRT